MPSGRRSAFGDGNRFCHRYTSLALKEDRLSIKIEIEHWPDINICQFVAAVTAFT